MVSGADPAVADANRRVAEEMERFQAALPTLLLDDSVRGRWVVFKDGVVVRAFDDEAVAYAWARDTLGKLGVSCSHASSPSGRTSSAPHPGLASPTMTPDALKLRLDGPHGPHAQVFSRSGLAGSVN